MKVTVKAVLLREREQMRKRRHTEELEIYPGYEIKVRYWVKEEQK